jgi:hypothetical protein
MARGFESKDVEFQQAEAERAPATRRALSAEERDALAQRRTVELSLARAKADLQRARNDAHRQMLTAAITALEAQLSK